MEKKIYMFLADGFETVEALAVADLLYRADVPVRTVSISDTKRVVSSHNIPVEADIFLSDVDFENADMLILPGGGPGTKNLAACNLLMNRVDEFVNSNRYVAAICAAPALILGERGLLKGRKAICYPGMENHLRGAIVTTESVVTDGNIITSRGMGTAIDLGLKLVEIMKGEETARALAEGIVYNN